MSCLGIPAKRVVLAFAVILVPLADATIFSECPLASEADALLQSGTVKSKEDESSATVKNDQLQSEKNKASFSVERPRQFGEAQVLSHDERLVRTGGAWEEDIKRDANNPLDAWTWAQKDLPTTLAKIDNARSQGGGLRSEVTIGNKESSGAIALSSPTSHPDEEFAHGSSGSPQAEESNKCTVLTMEANRGTLGLAAVAVDGSKCVFGVDPRDEDTHCIFDAGQFGTSGWCYTDADATSWGSCVDRCPLFGGRKVLFDKIDEIGIKLDRMDRRLEGLEGATNSTQKDKDVSEAKVDKKQHVRYIINAADKETANKTNKDQVGAEARVKEKRNKKARVKEASKNTMDKEDGEEGKAGNMNVAKEEQDVKTNKTFDRNATKGKQEVGEASADNKRSEGEDQVGAESSIDDRNTEKTDKDGENETSAAHTSHTEISAQTVLHNKPEPEQEKANDASPKKSQRVRMLRQELSGDGQCVDREGRLYQSYSARKARSASECAQLLEALAILPGLRGVQFETEKLECSVLVRKGFDPRRNEIPGGWSGFFSLGGQASGLVEGILTAKTGSTPWKCWRSADPTDGVGEKTRSPPPDESRENEG